jgi:hypothetical protein
MIMKLLAKIVVAVAALAVLGVLFVRSVQSTRSEPYTVDRGRLGAWRLAIEPGTTPSAPLLSLRAPPELASALFRQIFARAAESLSGPSVPAIPIILRNEFDRALATFTSPEALLAAAQEAGLEAAAFEPRCMAYRRESAPGITHQLYFVLFEAPAFSAFRERLGAQAAAAGAVFDPAALSPVLIIAASDPMFSRWFPLQADPERDCVAPIAID